jgi:hypothetical protein
MHPKVYIALDAAELDKLQKKIESELFLAKNSSIDTDAGSKIAECVKALDIIEWIRIHDIYTRPFSGEDDDRIF